MRTRLGLLFACLGLLGSAAFGRVEAGSLLREVFENIGGSALSDLTNNPAFPNSPTSTGFVTDFFESPTDTAENYGQRVHGYIVPPTTGSYTFWISSDDQGALFLSTDEFPANKRQIAHVPEWTGSREWGKYAQQQSTPITLQANKAYYIEALQKEGGGGDNLAVRWLRPGNIDEGPIPGTYLLPWGTAFTPPNISQQPTNTSVVEGQMATFVVKVTNVDPVTYRWQRNGVNVPSSDTSVLTFGPVTMADQGANFGAVLTNRIGSTNTTLATLTVLPDTTKPVLLSATSLGNTRIRLIFSEPMDPTSAGVPANFQVSGGVTVTAAAIDAEPTAIVITVAGMNFAQNYTVTVSNVKDRAQTANTIAANSIAGFLALELTAANVGGGTGGITRIGPGAFDLSGRGRGVSGNSDQFQLSWELRSGDFDVQTRLVDLGVSDPFVRAGIMARSNLETNGLFAATFSASAQVGSFFESRTASSGAPARQTIVGGYPANYPWQWLRLRRSGSTFTGFASRDGQAWVQLGSTSVTMPSQIYVGLSLSSQTAATGATAKFRDYGATVSTATTTFVNDRESFTPSSRRTGLVISELMYHPKPATDVTANLEFIEIYNAGAIFQELTGWRLAGGVDYRFPDGFRIEAGQFVVVAADPAAVQAAYGLTGVLGPFTGSLNNAGDTVQLRDSIGAIKLDLEYSPDAPWPVAADGAGHSLVLSAPSYGEADPRAWSASALPGGSPGQVDPVVPAAAQSVVINEFLAHTDDPQLDFVELYNRSNQPVDLSGHWLSDDATTNKFRLPDGTLIPARGFVVFDQVQLGFALNAAGETIYFLAADGARVLDAVRFGGQENGVSSGRLPNGSGTIRRLAAPTPGAANAGWRAEAVVINELMFAPVSGDDAEEYVELHNRTAAPVDLGGWRFTAGIDFEFPPGAALPANGYLVVAKDAARLRAGYPHLTAANTFGDYGGALRNSGERVALAKPDTIRSTNQLGELETNRIHIVISEVTYADGGQWCRWADGGGSSLELIDPDADPLRAANWRDSDETAKAQWSPVEFTGRLDHGNGSYGINRFFLGLLNDGECLVDDIEVVRGTGANLVSNGGFESGATGWTFFGNHSDSTVVSAGAFAGTRALHLRAGGGLDTGPNTIRTALGAGLAANDTVTIRARVRWLAGWPELLFRLRGSFLDYAAPLPVPTNLGTPGLPNSRRVANAGPAIYDVTHTPALPRANEPVIVTARVSDPDGLGNLNLRFRTDPSATLSTLAMRDDGTAGDAVAGDGLYSATISGRAGGTLIAFRLEATDASGASAVFPPGVPADECLIRWGDPVPFGSFPNVYLWNTQANQSAPDGNALNNKFRRGTLVYGHRRVIYNVLFRDKGSPYHGGAGDIVISAPKDDKLHGVRERVMGSTGNGDSETTGLRSRLAAWLGKEMGIPHLNGNYLRFYRNGSQFRNLVEDLEEPDHRYAEQNFPDGEAGDLYKLSIWFEFEDNNRSFSPTQTTLQRFTTTGNQLKTARYRWNWKRRTQVFPEEDFTTIFDLVNAANSPSGSLVNNLLNHADVEQWMRVHAYNRVMGNWDAWTFSVGQNMYLYRQPGRRAVLMPWDLDFTFGLGNGSSDGLWGGQDPVGNTLYDTPAFRRMLWRAYLDAVNGPMLEQNYGPVITALRSAQTQNNITGLGATSSINTYINARRSYILGQINSQNAAAFAITSNGGNNFTSTTPTVNLVGTAPFQVATIAVNGVAYPATWTSFTTFSISVPLTQQVNALAFAGRDRLGNPVPGMTDTITVTYNGVIQAPQDYVVINELHYNPAEPQTGFIELHNRSTSTPFNLSGFRLEGVGYTLPEGTIIPANGYLVIAGNAAAFATRYGGGIPLVGEFPGRLDNDGETIRLVKPGATPEQDVRISDLRYYDRLPWPVNADGFGPSLQLIDPALGSWNVGNWAVTATNAANRTTPGAANSVRATLPALPAVWLNEVLPNNVGGPTDAAGEREPFIELYNAGDTAVDLAPFYLTDDYASLTKWQFPAGTTIGPKQFLIVWADGEGAESTAAAPHTSFRLHATTGRVALVRTQGFPSAPAVMDFVDYAGVPAGRSLGSYPDGEPRRRRSFFHVTPGAANNPAFPAIQVTINEFMAQNNSTIANPADGAFDDWFELHNAGAEPVDLTSYSLTDDLTDKTQFVIPPGYVIPPGGFLLVWADNEPGRNSPADRALHVNFALARAGESLGLFSPDGTQVDGFTFTEQTSDVSRGRFPDGSDGPLLALDPATPGTSNLIPGGNLPPVVNPITDKEVNEGELLNFTASATDADAGQTLTYSLGVDAPAGAAIDEGNGQVTWTPTEAQGPGIYTFTVRATDNGTPARTGAATVKVTVAEVNRPPVIPELAEVTVDEASLFSLLIPATDPDLPANALAFSLVEPVPAGAAIDAASGELTWTPAEAQGGAAYDLTVRVTDNGTPPLSAERVLRVNVREVNNPPVITQLSPQFVDEGAAFSLTVQAADPEGAAVRFSLAPGAPAGLAINPDTGLLTWSPTEAQGPGNYPVVVRVQEQTADALVAQMTFTITVNEVNQPPVLAALPDRTVTEGDTVSFIATATDADRPAQTLAYSLVEPFPAGAALDPNTGAFGWTTGDDAGATTNVLTVRVTDNGPGNLTDSKTFTVITRPRFKVALSEIMCRPLTNRAEYVELTNPSASTAWDISGFRLVGNELNFTFPANTVLAPGAALCVARDVGVFRATYGNTLPVAGAWTGILGAAADSLRLVRPGTPGATVDQVDYRTTAPWPTVAATGAALQVVDLRRDNSRVGNWAAAAAYNGPRQLSVMTNLWRYYQAGPPPAGWNQPAFSDAAWAQGRGLLYVETAPLQAPKTTALTLGQMAYYFRAKFTLPSVPAGATLRLRHIIDDGAVFYLNGRELHRFGFGPNVVVQHDTPAALIGDAALVGPVTLPADLLQAGENVLAVEVHQTSANSSDIVFGADLFLEGGSVPGQTPGATNNVAAALPEFPAVYLNEVLPNNTTGLTDSKGEREPWVEVFNAGATAVDLTGWSLTDNYSDLGKWVFPASTLMAPGQFLVVFLDGEAADATATELHTGFRLASANGSLALVRPQNGGRAVVDYVDFGTVAANSSLAALPDGQLFDREISTKPTPGAFNTGTPPNRAPVLGTIASQEVAEGSQLTFTASATDADAGQTLTYTLTGAVPAGAALTPAGVFTWTPTEAQGPGNFTVTVVVTDNGVPPLTDEQAVNLTVLERNVAPTLVAPTVTSIPENVLWTAQFTGSDSDVPANALTYSLVEGPPGVSVDATTGVVSWTPTEAQGPGNFTITVRVTDNGTPALNAQAALSVTVTEVNLAPTLTGPASATIPELQKWTGQFIGTDDDLPANTLTYLLVNSPAGLDLDRATGAATWTPLAIQGPGEYTVTVRVTDSGSPVRSAEHTLVLTVVDSGSAPTPAATLNPEGTVTLTWPTLNGVTYRLEVADQADGRWQTLSTVTGTGARATTTDNPGARTERFYRLVIP